MICKLFHLMNSKLEGMYIAKGWFTTMILAIKLDANNFFYQIAQLTQLTSPERLDQIKYIEQREESMQQIVSGNYYHDAILS